MNGIRTGPPWLWSNLPLKISTICRARREKKNKPQRLLHSPVPLQKHTQWISHLLISISTFTYISSSVPNLRAVDRGQKRGPRQDSLGASWLCQSTGVWRPFEGESVKWRGWIKTLFAPEYSLIATLHHNMSCPKIIRLRLWVMEWPDPQWSKEGMV